MEKSYLRIQCVPQGLVMQNIDKVVSCITILNKRFLSGKESDFTSYKWLRDPKWLFWCPISVLEG